MMKIAWSLLSTFADQIAVLVKLNASKNLFFFTLSLFITLRLNELFLSAGKMNIDDWSVREKLVLACCVVRSGDQNWYEMMMSFEFLIYHFLHLLEPLNAFS